MRHGPGPGAAARVAVAGLLLGALFVPPAGGSEPTGATLHVSWTRPGVSGTLLPPSKLRVGDTVTVRLALTGFTRASCAMHLHHLGNHGAMAAIQTNEVAVDGAGYCHPWTFTLPPAPAGSISLDAAASGDDPAGADASATPPVVTLTVEGGGTRRPFASTYPASSWAPIDFAGTAAIDMNVPLVLSPPPGATRMCRFETNVGVGAAPLDAGICAAWHVTLPDLRPAAEYTTPGAGPLEATFGIRGSATDDATGADLEGAGLATVLMDGTGGQSMSSSLPAVSFPQGASNPRYVLAGETVHVAPRLHAVTSGATCAMSYGRSDDHDFVEWTAPVVDGACPSYSFVASVPGQYGTTVALTAGEYPGASSGFSLWAIDPMTVPSLGAEPATAGSPFEVDASVTSGLPSAYEFSLSGSGFSSLDRRLATTDGVTASASPCSSGTLDFLAEQRTARGTCTAPAAGSYTLAIRFTDVTGATKTRSRSITVGDPSAGVVDIAGHKFESDIRWLYTTGITKGCTPDRFCPDGLVTRAQMATFLARALPLPSTTRDYFTDDEASKHEGAINRLRAAGITYGCSATTFCPDGLVTRAQMASFLTRAFDLASTPRDYFTDDEGNRHEDAINRLRAAGITSGCAETRYCPSGAVTRGQMAAFLHRAVR